MSTPGSRATRTKSTDQKPGTTSKLPKEKPADPQAGNTAKPPKEKPADPQQSIPAMAANKESRVCEERLKLAKTNIMKIGSLMESDAQPTLTITQLNGRIAKLNTLWSQYEDTHVSLVADAATREASVAYSTDYNTVDDLVTKLKDNCSDRIAALKKSQQPRETVVTGASTSNEQQRSGVTIITGDGLGNVANTWGKFTGDHENWHTFRDCFESSIHTNEQLEPIRKFQYLLAALDGAAHKTVTQLKFTASNYEAAWDRLKETYEDNYTATRQLMRGLFDLPRIKKPTTESLRNIVDSVHYALAQLTHFVKTDNWDHWIAFLVLQRLDARTLHAWEAHRTSKLCTTANEANRLLPQWPQVKEFLDQRARILMAAPTEDMDVDNNNDEASGGQRKRQRQDSRRHSSQTTTNAPRSRQNDGQASKYPMCIFCKVIHPLFSCPKFRSISLKARIKCVEENNICPGCLQQLSRDHQCRQHPCHKCQDGKVHSSFLCPTKEAEVQTELLNRDPNPKPVNAAAKRHQGPTKD